MSQALNDWKVGEETKLSQRYKSKQVYAKLIDFGQLPTGSPIEKTVPHNISGMDQFGIDHSRSYVVSADGQRHGLDITGSPAWVTQVGPLNVYMACNTNTLTHTAMICIWYTKEDEEPGEIPLPGSLTEEDVQGMIDLAKCKPATEAEMGVGYVATLAEAETGRTEPGRNGAPAFITPEGMSEALSRISVRAPESNGLSLYVRLDGNDANDGRSNSPGGAVKTYSAVRRILHGLDMKDSLLRLYFGPGVHTNVIELRPGDFCGQDWTYLYAIDPQSPPTFQGSHPLSLTDHPAGVSVMGNMNFTATGNGICIFASRSYVEVRDCTVGIGGTAERGIDAYTAGSIFILNSKGNFSGTIAHGVLSEYNSYVRFWNSQLNYNKPNFTSAGVTCTTGSQVLFQNTTCIGSATGRRYHANCASIIHTGNAGQNFLPGTVAGIAETNNGGIYY